MTMLDLVNISLTLEKLNEISTKVTYARSSLDEATKEALKEFITNIIKLHKVIIDSLKPFYGLRQPNPNFGDLFAKNLNNVKVNKLLSNPKLIRASCDKTRNALDQIAKARKGRFKNLILGIIGQQNNKADLKQMFKEWVFRDDMIYQKIRDFRDELLKVLKPIEEMLKRNNTVGARKKLKQVLSGSEEYFDKIQVNYTQCKSLLELL